jgi:hypothetical protein
MANFRTLAARFNALQSRERILIVAVALAILYALSDLLWFSPQQAEAKRLQERLKAQVVEQDAFAKALQQMAGKPRATPADQQRQERDALLATVQDAEKIIAAASTDVRPGAVIRTLTSSAPGVTLVSLRTLPSQSLFDPEAAKAPGPGQAASAPRPGASGANPALVGGAAAPLLPRLYRHRVEVAVKGAYPAVVAYLQSLERSVAVVFWENLRLEAKYPESTTRFTLSILSTQPELVLE